MCLNMFINVCHNINFIIYHKIFIIYIPGQEICAPYSRSHFYGFLFKSLKIIRSQTNTTRITYVFTVLNVSHIKTIPHKRNFKETY
jgi:hypothetical protein